MQPLEHAVFLSISWSYASEQAILIIEFLNNAVGCFYYLYYSDKTYIDGSSQVQLSRQIL